MGEVRVLKFGGSSVANASLIHKVAEIVEAHYRQTQRVVVVVSAMGKSTDQLVALAKEVSPQASEKHRRELDMMLSVGERISMSLLSMAIRDRGIEAISLTGSQSGIITTQIHGEAEIEEIRGDRIHKALGESKVVIVAGFQGVSREKEITTLGRGGSDTTALALAHYLGAPRAAIYSDVDAYYSADPKLVPAAHRYSELPWELGVLSSFFGAKVLHYRAAELAALNQLEIHLLSTFNPQGSGGYLRGSVSDKIDIFQVFTLNLKKGLQKLTTKIQSGLDKKYLSELKGLFSPPINAFYTISSGDESGDINHVTSKVLVHFGEKFSGHQAPAEKNFTPDENEYWSLTLVGTGLHTRKELFAECAELFSALKVQNVAYSSNPLYYSLVFPAAPEKEKELLETFHAKFFG